MSSLFKKKLFIIVASLLLFVSGCGKKKNVNLENNDFEEGRRITVGVTYFEPMNYFDQENRLVGFDTELAEQVYEKLSMKPTFIEIDWDSKETELNSRNLDCVWNGLTKTADRENSMFLSKPYLKNKLVMIVRREDERKFVNGKILNDNIVVAEKGSIGSETLENNEIFSKCKKINVESQVKTLLELKSRTADIALVDYMAAASLLKPDTDFSDLMVLENKNFSPVDEEIVVAFRKDDVELAKKVDEVIDELKADGQLLTLAKKYDLEKLCCP